ncbi:MAG: peptide chain release factor N(5)-glutamine methyltransferase [Rubrivivax sp.]|jgi:release factor glutamine methyltransferase|nr:peptide chain release factor N(5)-glutamine methyltransferase [Rubrivivax sp.]
MVADPPPSVGAALALARRLGVARLDAQWLLTALLRQPRSWLLAHDDAPLDPALARACLAALQRRAAGEPLAYVLGETRFCGLDLNVTPAVLIPRPETELLVDWAIEALQPQPAPKVLDLGTGSGAIVLAVGQRRPDAVLHASDLSAEALAVARANADRLGRRVAFAQGPWWQPWAGQPFDLVLANPPYIAAGDPHLAALHHEPQLALSPGGDGLEAIRQIAVGAAPQLAAGAWLLFEHGHDQGPATRALLESAGFARVETRADLAGLPRCTGGQWSSRART